MIKKALTSFFRLFYPNVCAGCGQGLVSGESVICLNCHQELKPSLFLKNVENPFYRIMSSRLPIERAASFYYFTKGGIIQKMMHEMKYNHNTILAEHLGSLFGKQIVKHETFLAVEAIIPIPLHFKKQKTRGYNQCDLIAAGMGKSMQIPVFKQVLERVEYTETQTKRSRSERWENVKNAFQLKDSKSIQNKHVLLLDDVMTTGSTLEACARALLEVEGITISIATLVYADEV